VYKCTFVCILKCTLVFLSELIRLSVFKCINSLTVFFCSPKSTLEAYFKRFNLLRKTWKNTLKYALVYFLKKIRSSVFFEKFGEKNTLKCIFFKYALVYFLKKKKRSSVFLVYKVHLSVSLKMSIKKTFIWIWKVAGLNMIWENNSK
jgi:hypothetical protein